jgi:chemotaxis protein CheD
VSRNIPDAQAPTGQDESPTNPDTGSPIARALHYLHPSRFFVASRPHSVTTILGSCVAVCLWDPARKVGGINHYLLPEGPGASERPARFGTHATGLLIKELLALGCNRRNLRAKIFGGACVLGTARQDASHLGLRNIDVARLVLKEEGIPIVVEDVGGDRGRKLMFQTDDGDTMVKVL